MHEIAHDVGKGATVPAGGSAAMCSAKVNEVATTYRRYMYFTIRRPFANNALQPIPLICIYIHI